MNPNKRATIKNPIYSLCARLPVIIALTFIFVSAARGAVVYTNVVLADNPIGYWPLIVGNSTTATNLAVSGKANNGIYENITSANKVAGPSAYIPNAVSFNGTSDYVNLTNETLMNVSGKISMEAWVQPASSQLQQYADIFAKGYYNGGSPYYEIEMSDVNSDEFVSGRESGYYSSSSGGTVTTNWTYLVSTYDGTNWNLYVNGALVGTTADPTGPSQFTDPWAIGNGTDGGAGRFFTGNICQVALYTNALTPAQVVTHYFTGLYGTTNVPPFIVVQPASQMAYTNEQVSFSVIAVATTPLSYQWWKGASQLGGQTSATLTIGNVQPADGGSYSVVITDNYGAVTSSVANLTVVARPTAYENAILADNPIGYWPLDLIVDSSGTATDLSGNGNIGTYDNISSPNNEVAGPSAYIPDGASFNGFSSWVDLRTGTNTSVLNVTGKITLEAWVQPASSQQLPIADIFAKGYYNGGSPYYEIEMNDAANAYFDSGRESGYYSSSSGGTVTTNWTYLVSTYDKTNWNLYVDAALVGTMADPSGPSRFIDPWAIGNGTDGGAGRFFTGNICQVAIYTNALTPARVYAHYAVGMYGTTNVAPVIFTQPVSQRAVANTTVTFAVVATGNPPLGYQWYSVLGGVTNSIAGATNATYTTPPMALTNNGEQFYVVCTDADNNNMVVSSNATLTVVPPSMSTYPNPPAGTPSFADFTAQVSLPGGSYSNLFTYGGHIFSSVSNEPVLVGFVMFDCSTTVQMQVTYNAGTLTSALIWPQSYGITPTINGNVMTFNMTNGQNVVLEVNGNEFEALHIFANPTDTNLPSPSNPNVLYFGPGLHKYGGSGVDSHIVRYTTPAQWANGSGTNANVTLDQITVPAGVTAYLAPGSVLQAVMVGEGNNVTIRGRGVVDFSPWCGNFTLAGLTNVPQMQTAGIQAGGTNTTFEGIVDMDPPGLGMIPWSYSTVNNVKVFTCMGGGDDGIDYGGVQNLIIENSFVRSTDDAADMSDCNGVTYSNDVIAVQGLGTSAWVFDICDQGTGLNNFLIEKCYVIYCGGNNIGAAAIHMCAGGNSSVRNMTFTNLYIERVFGPPINIYPHEYWCGGSGSISNITFANVRWTTNYYGYYGFDNLGDWSALGGFSPSNAVTGLNFDNCYLNGNLITNGASGELTIGSYVSGLIFNGVVATEANTNLALSPLLIPPLGTTNYYNLYNANNAAELYDMGNGSCGFGNGAGPEYKWQLVSDSGFVRFVNQATGNSMNCNLNNGAVQASAVTNWSADWMPIGDGGISYTCSACVFKLRNRLYALENLSDGVYPYTTPAFWAMSEGDFSYPANTDWYLLAATSTIGWVGPTGITGDANLSTNGAYVDAVIPNTGASNLTVDGVTFHAAANLRFNAYGDSVITFSGTNLNNYSYAGSFPVGGPASANFATLMDEGGVFQYGGSGSGTVTISRLTLGDTYQVQVFNYAPGTGDMGLTTMSGSPAVTLSIKNGAGGANTYGEFATGTFTAAAGTESFDWNGAGSSYTVLGSISVRQLPPAAPTGLTATAGNAQVSLSWTASLGATSYNVKRSTISNDEVTITNVTSTSYTDPGLANGTTYYYEISALNAGGQSTNSSQVSATPVGPPLVLSAALATGGQFTLQFNGADGQSYIVEMSTNLADGNWTPVFTNTQSGGVFTYTDTNITDAARFYRVSY